VKTTAVPRRHPPRLLETAPHLEAALSVWTLPPRKFDVSAVRCETVMVATQTVCHDPERPSHLALSIIGEGPKWATTGEASQ